MPRNKKSTFQTPIDFKGEWADFFSDLKQDIDAEYKQYKKWLVDTKTKFATAKHKGDTTSKSFNKLKADFEALTDYAQYAKGQQDQLKAFSKLWRDFQKDWAQQEKEKQFALAAKKTLKKSAPKSKAKSKSNADAETTSPMEIWAETVAGSEESATESEVPTVEFDFV